MFMIMWAYMSSYALKAIAKLRTLSFALKVQ